LQCAEKTGLLSKRSSSRTEEINISELSYNFSIPYLEMENTDDWNLSINQLLENLKREVTHSEKMEKSDLKYPIDIYYFRDNWIILDGVHRLAKAKNLGYRKIKIRKVREEDIEKIRI
ncbi:MAG: hypothetical protein AAB632_00820, partial [Patescibacteria group bacterium]